MSVTKRNLRRSTGRAISTRGGLYFFASAARHIRKVRKIMSREISRPGPGATPRYKRSESNWPGGWMSARAMHERRPLA